MGRPWRSSGETLSSGTGGVGSTPGLGARIQNRKEKNRSNTVENSTKALKKVHIKKKSLKWLFFACGKIYM